MAKFDTRVILAGMEPNPFLEDLIARGIVPPLPHRFEPPSELTWRHLLLARLMIHGCADAGMLAFLKRRTLEKVAGEKKRVWVDAPSPEPYEPLPVDEAASLAGVRRRFARELADTAIFKQALRAEKRRAGADLPSIDEEVDGG